MISHLTKQPKSKINLFLILELVFRIGIILVGGKYFLQDLAAPNTDYQMSPYLDTAVFWLLPSLFYSIFSGVIIGFAGFIFDKTKRWLFLLIFEMFLLAFYYLTDDRFSFLGFTIRIGLTFVIFIITSILNILYLNYLKLSATRE